LFPSLMNHRPGRLPSRLAALALAAGLLGAAFAPPALAAPKTSTIYSFTGAADGGFPYGGVIADDQGKLYGTVTAGGNGHSGAVYQLSKAPGGGWTQSTLYAFSGGADGGMPMAGLLMGAKGRLYGTTAQGGASGNGVVFELSPPKKGQSAWTQKVLWTFAGGDDGSMPTGTLAMDAAGNLYGTTNWGGTGVVGTVFKLSPPANGAKDWTETVLYNFTGNNDGGEPSGRMLVGSDGNLYGTTSGWGEFNLGNVFKLTAQGDGSWHFSVLHAFAGGADGEVPRDGLIQGPDGTLYGATAGFAKSYGNVFSLNTDGSGYQPLWQVTGGEGYTGNGPWQSLSIDADGNLYGATMADGTSWYGEIFQLKPPHNGEQHWRAKVLHTFQLDADGEFPYTTVLVHKGKLYGTTYGAAGQSGYWPGTVWRITP
jgi:uncharacterized repeat protein (TIGR03803 family)